MLQHDETLARKFVKKGFWLYFFTFLSGPIGYIIKIIISHDLSVGEVGIVYGVIGFVTLLSGFNDFGCTESLNYFLPKHIIKNEYAKAKYLLRLALFVQIASSIIITTVMFLLAPWLAEHHFHTPAVIEPLRIAGIYFIGINIFHISSSLLSVAQDTKLQKWSDFFRLMSTLIGTALLFFTGNGNTENYMWAWAIGTLSGCIFIAYLAYTRYYRPYFSSIKTVSSPSARNTFYKYAVATALTANIGILFSQVDTQLIFHLLGDEANGYYSNYLSLLNIPFIFIAPIVGFLFPVISELNSREDASKLRTIHQQFSLYFSIIGIWLGIFMFQHGEALAIGFFGEKFRTSGTILAYSAFFLIFNLLVQINFQFLAGTGRIKSRIKILLSVLLINIILNIVLIQKMWVQGSALAVWLSWIPLWFLSFLATQSHQSRFDWIAFGKNIILATLTFFITREIVEWWNLMIDSRIGAFEILGIAIFINLVIFTLWNWNMLRQALSIIQKNKH